MRLKLSEYKINQVGIVLEVLENNISNKMIEFGLLPGAHFRILSKAPFSGPIFIQIDNNRIAIRRKEAALIIVE